MLSTQNIYLTYLIYQPTTTLTYLPFFIVWLNDTTSSETVAIMSKATRNVCYKIFAFKSIIRLFRDPALHKRKVMVMSLHVSLILRFIIQSVLKLSSVQNWYFYIWSRLNHCSLNRQTKCQVHLLLRAL